MFFANIIFLAWHIFCLTRTHSATMSHCITTLIFLIPANLFGQLWHSRNQFLVILLLHNWPWRLLTCEFSGKNIWNVLKTYSTLLYADEIVRMNAMAHSANLYVPGHKFSYLLDKRCLFASDALWTRVVAQRLYFVYWTWKLSTEFSISQGICTHNMGSNNEKNTVLDFNIKIKDW